MFNERVFFYLVKIWQIYHFTLNLKKNTNKNQETKTRNKKKTPQTKQTNKNKINHKQQKNQKTTPTKQTNKQTNLTQNEIFQSP